LFLGTQNSYHGLEIWRGARPAALLASPKSLESEIRGDDTVVLSWEPSEGAARFRVFRSAFTSNRELRIPELDADTYVPASFKEVGVTDRFYLVDEEVETGQHYYHYYVVAEDTAGTRSRPSNLVRAPSLARPVTFDNLQDTAARWAGQEEGAPFPQDDAIGLLSSLEQVRHDVAIGDLNGALGQTAHLRHLARADRINGLPSWRVADLEVLLSKLERRIRLIKAGILSPAILN
jgi:hypothetical protein